MYGPNIRPPKYIKQVQTDLNGEVDNSTIIVGDFITPLSNRFPSQKINTETLDMNHTLEQIDLTDIYKTFHPTAAEYTFFSSAHGTFSMINHMIDHKISLRKLKNIQIIPSIYSDYNGMKLEINKRKDGKFTNM